MLGHKLLHSLAPLTLGHFAIAGYCQSESNFDYPLERTSVLRSTGRDRWGTLLADHLDCPYGARAVCVHCKGKLVSPLGAATMRYGYSAPRARGDRVGWCSQLPKLPRIGLLPYKAGDNGSYRQPAEHTRAASFHTDQQERGILSLSTSLPISSWLVRFPVEDQDGLAPLTDLSQDRAVENGICRSSLAAKITQKSSFTRGNWRKCELPLGHWAA